jgi:glycosyltransferase involved in cell wall biosynthesis
VGLIKSATAKKPRLLIILNRFVIGGQAVDTIPLAYALQEDFDILLLYGEKQPDEIEPGYLLESYPGLTLKKISHLRRSINPLVDVVAFFRLLQVMVQFRPHIVHTHGAKSGFLGRIAAYISRVPVIIHTFHGHFFHSYFSSGISKFVALVEKFVGRITTAAIALSSSQKQEIAELYKIFPAGKLTVIPLGFKNDEHAANQPYRGDFRNRYNIHPNEIAIGIVGRLVPVKDHAFFIDVIEKYAHKFGLEKVVFLIVGDGELRKPIQNRLDQKGISFSSSKAGKEHRVLFTSWLYNMEEVMTGLDIVALTSLNEGTPLSLIEAQYFGKPVVCTNVGGVKDTIVNEETGYLVPPQNATAFCDFLKKLVDDHALRDRMGAAGHQFISSTFSKENEVRLTKEFYFSLLRKKHVL